MSLINKMLQDLDARASGGASSAVQQDEVKSVPSMERDRRPVLLLGAAAGALVLAAGGWYGWQYWQAHQAPPPPPAPQPVRMVDNRMPDTTASVKQPPAAKPAEPAAVESIEPKVAEPKPAPAPAPEPVPSIAKPKRQPQEHAAPARPAPPVASPAASDGVMQTPKQMSENSYRRALAALQEGRVSAALAELEKAVEIDPRNDAARQTYVSLLLENRRTDDAIRQLRLALGIDPRQPGLAMVLARLQLEKGGPALDTLLKSLPYAGNSPEYHAFLAGVLQREQRHAEAADHYRAALQLAPQNGVWWMGLGISLQADQHLPEAREAYNRARSAGGLTPELRSYVERQIDKLSR